MPKDKEIKIKNHFVFVIQADLNIGFFVKKNITSNHSELI